MSEYIVHTSVAEDCFNILLISDDIIPLFKEVIKKHRRFAHLGSITRGGDKFIVNLISKYKKEWNDNFEHRLAFVLGWLCHRATDREMKPLYRELEPESSISPKDCSIYQDVFIFKEFYLKNSSKALLEDKMESTNIVNPLILELARLILQRLLIEIHTLIPDKENIEIWIDKLFKLKQDFYVDIKRYEDVLNKPDKEKFRKFILESNFFNENDPLIIVAKKLREKTIVNPDEVRKAIYSKNESFYARSIRLSYEYIFSASEFFQDKIREDELTNRLNIGKPGRDGIYV